jgi:hypothetical protein
LAHLLCHADTPQSPDHRRGKRQDLAIGGRLASAQIGFADDTNIVEQYDPASD